MTPAHSRLRHQKPDLIGHLLRLGIDLGTGKIQIDGQHLQPGISMDDADIIPICLKNDQSARVEQTAILCASGEVIYGTMDVEDAIAADPALQDRVLELWKLALHPEFQNLDEVKHVLDTIYARNEHGGKDDGAVQDFLEDQLRRLLQDVRDFYKNSDRNAGKDTAYWDGITLELQISVPAMWGDVQRGIVRNAACNALRKPGEETPSWRVELREEPLCVGTVYMLALSKSGSIKEGQCLLLIDCGKGTLDIATVKLVRAPSHRVLLQLERVGPCSGNGAGSHTVNTQAWRWILSGACEQVLNLDERCKHLGITRREFLRQFSIEMDRIKKDIQKIRHGIVVTIMSSHGQTGPGRLSRLQIELPKELVISWYKVWTDSATQLVREHLNLQHAEQYRCVSLTGGGCMSSVLRKELEAVLSQDPYNIVIGTATACISPCSQGALLQHFFQEDKLPPSASFYLALAEEYKNSVHKDIAARASEFKTSTKIVPERLHRIMRYEEGTGFTSEGKTLINFLLQADGLGDRIHVDLYYSEEDLEEHSALREADDNIRSGIRSYPPFFVDIDDPAGHGFTQRKGGKDGKDHFELKTYVQMEGSDDKLEIILYVMKHDYRYPWEKGGRPFSKTNVFSEHRKEIWNKFSSHFVRSITNQKTDPQKTDSKQLCPPITPQNTFTKRKNKDLVDRSRSSRKRKTTG